MLGKDERYGGVVLGKDRFNKDVSLCYFKYLSYMSTVHILNKKRKLALFSNKNAQQNTSIFFQKVLIYEGRSSNKTPT